MVLRLARDERANAYGAAIDGTHERGSAPEVVAEAEPQRCGEERRRERRRGGEGGLAREARRADMGGDRSARRRGAGGEAVRCWRGARRGAARAGLRLDPN